MGPKAWDSEEAKARIVSRIEQPSRETGGNSDMANQSSTTHTLKQMLKMGACCAGPILGLALLAPLASSLGAGVSSVFSFLLVLACPLSMLFMMYMMRGKPAMQDHSPAQERPLAEATPSSPSVAATAGNGQPEEHQASPVMESATSERKLPGPQVT